MNDIVLEQITQSLKTAVATINNPTDFNYALTVEREKRWGNQPADCKVVIYQGNPRDDDNTPYLTRQWIVPYTLEIFVQIPENQNDTLLPSVKLNQISGDIWKVVMLDRQRTNLALDTKVLPWEEFQTIDGKYCGRSFICEVTYRTLDTDPYQTQG